MQECLPLLSGISLPLSTGRYSQCVARDDTAYYLTTVLTARDEAASTKIAEFGLCVPAECGTSDVKPIVHELAKRSGLPVPASTRLAVWGKDTLVAPDWQTFAALLFVVFLVLIVLLTTYLHGRSGGLFVRSFALQETWPKLFAAEANVTSALNGVRVLSMVWIVLGHSFLMAGATAGYRNPDFLFDPRYGRTAGPFFWHSCDCPERR
jgi:hypothetical protein